MVYERYPRSTGSQGDNAEGSNYRREQGGYSSARDYAAAGRLGGDRDGRYDREDQGYGQRGSYDRDRDDNRSQGYGRQERTASDWGSQDRDRGYDGRSDNDRQYQGQSYGRGGRDHGENRYGTAGRGSYGSDAGRGSFNDGGNRGYYGSDEYRGSYASDGRRFEEVGRNRGLSDDNRRDNDRGYGRQPQGYDYEERGFFQRAGDEVRSWFGDDDAERRREADARYDENAYRQGGQHDDHYGSWRTGQMAALDRDYDEYRTENRSRFEKEFSTWRTTRQGQRDLLDKVTEHQEVVGSDGAHVGTVDKVRGDRIILTRTDSDAGGRHHSIPSSWLESADDKVKLSKTADEAKKAWRDEERNQAMFGDQDRQRDTGNRGGMTGGGTSSTMGGMTGSGATTTGGATATGAGSNTSSNGLTGDTSSSSSSSATGSGDTNLNRSFSGTY